MCKVFCFCFQFLFLALGIILSRRGEDIHPCLVPDRKKKESIQSFILNCNVSYMYFCKCPSSVWGLSLVLFIFQFFYEHVLTFVRKNIYICWDHPVFLPSFFLLFLLTLSLFPPLPPSFLPFLQLSSCLRKNNKPFSITSSLMEGLFLACGCVLIWVLLAQIAFITCCCCSANCLTLCNPMDCSTPGFSVLHSLPSLLKLFIHHITPLLGNGKQLIFPIECQNFQTLFLISACRMTNFLLDMLFLFFSLKTKVFNSSQQTLIPWFFSIFSPQMLLQYTRDLPPGNCRQEFCQMFAIM